MVYFERKGFSKKISEEGRVPSRGTVTWVLSNGLIHISIAGANANKTGTNYNIVHNIGDGQVEEDVLLSYKITGHYRMK